MKFKLNNIYEIIYYDHFSTEGVSPKEAIKNEGIVLSTYGRCIGYNNNYVVLCWNFENTSSDNNDNMHVLKVAIKKVRKL